MSWLRIDDNFADHPKLVSLGAASARWAYLELLIYCAKHKTGGYFPAEIADTHRRLTPAFIDKCVTVGLVDRVENGDLCIHDWATYNPVKDVTGAVRQQRWRNAQRNGVVTENVTDVVTPSRARVPVPSRPVEQNPSTPTALETYGNGDGGEHDPDEVNRLLAEAAVKDMPT